MRDVLLEDRLEASESPLYDKTAGPAYLYDNARVTETRDPHRFSVAMLRPGKRTPDEIAFEVVRYAAELGHWLDYEGNFEDIRAYFRSKAIPFRVVIKHPELTLAVPSDIETINWRPMRKDRFYCLTSAADLGRMPVQVDSLGELRGYAVHNPNGVLAVFVEPVHY